MAPRIICSICNRHARVCNDFCEIDCGHVFHLHCLMDQSNTCPLCNQTFRSTKPLYFNFQTTSEELPIEVDGFQAALTYSLEVINNLKDEIALVKHRLEIAKNMILKRSET